MNLKIKLLFEFIHRYKTQIMVGAFFAIFIPVFLIYNLIFHRITIVMNNHSQTILSLKSSIAEVFQEKKIIIKPDDLVIPNLKTSITKDITIKIIRSFPVYVKYNGKTKKVYTIFQSVKKILQLAKIDLKSNFKIKPGFDEEVKPHQQIVITKETCKIEIRTGIIEPPFQYINAHGLVAKNELIYGRPGISQHWWNVFYEDGKETKRIYIKEKIIKEPVSLILLVSNWSNLRSLKIPQSRYICVKIRKMVATAYYPGPECTGKYAVYGLTYTGKKARYGLVAVDPKVIPLGTKLYIEGYGFAEAADIGGAIKGNKIDLCFNTYWEAKVYGRKKIKVCILEDSFLSNTLD